MDVESNPFAETWVDVKMPGGIPRLDQSQAVLLPDRRRTYVVGTVEVQNTDPLLGSMLSERSADPGIIPPFTLMSGRRQVVMLQCNLHERGSDASTGAGDPNGVVFTASPALWFSY